jgi:hypothetical protein
MIQQSLPLGGTANLRFAVPNNGAFVLGLAPTFTWYCDTSTSAHYGKFYDFVNAAWSDTPVQNPMSPVPGIAYVYGANVSQAGQSSSREAYIVTVMSNSVPYPYAEVTRYDFGAPEIAMIQELHRYTLAQRREFHRLNGDTSIQERVFDSRSGGAEIFRFTTTQETSGAQPEETRTNDSTLIGD